MRLTFDRGTLLLDAPLDAAVFAESGVMQWDSRVGAWRAPARAYADVTRALSGRDVRFSDAVRHSSGTPDVPPMEAPSLRPYQTAALSAWRASSRRGVIALPTGSGKTRIAIAAIADARARTLVLVPTRMLLDQWARELAAATEAPAPAPVDAQSACDGRDGARGRIGRLGDGERTVEAITVSTYESALRLMPEIGNAFEMLVVDETHHFGGGLRDETLEMSIAPMRLGLTATPGDGPTWDRVRALVGPVVYQLRVGDLIGTWLAGLDMITIPMDLEPDERDDYDRWMAEFRRVTRMLRNVLGENASWRELARLASRSPEGRRALASFREAQRLVALTARKRLKVGELLRQHRDSKVLVFTANNESAYEIARERLVMPITCDVGRTEREEVLEKFRRGELRALVSARVLNEGLDVPDADVAILVGAALGEREFVQRVGRLLRPAPGKRAIVYELVARDTLEENRTKKRRTNLASRAPVAPQA